MLRMRPPCGGRGSHARDVRGFFISFSFTALAGFALVYLPGVREQLITPFTDGITALAAWVMQMFGARVTLRANVLAIPGFAVKVLDVCNGVEASIILWSAILAFPASALHKLKGILVGTLAVHSLNIVRIVSLLYLGAYRRDLFHWVHAYLWDILIMLDVLLVFLLWVRLSPRPADQQRGAVAQAP